MKQKLFENVGGNNFRLITENVEESKSKLVREGLRKVFGGGKQQITYQFVQNVGLGYIKDVTEARKCALEEARIVAKECGYMEDEAKAKFVKTEAHEESDMGNPEEKSEVQIGKEILAHAEAIINISHTSAPHVEAIKKLSQELIDMHTKPPGRETMGGSIY